MNGFYLEGHADFTIQPEDIGELICRVVSGNDLEEFVGENGSFESKGDARKGKN